jgi:DnaA family protein
MKYDYLHQKRFLIGSQAIPDWSNYVISADNTVMVKHLQSLQQGEQVLLFGGPGVGCSHLVQAVCLQTEDKPCMYYHLAPNKPLQPYMLEGLNTQALVCIENIEMMAEDRAQQMGLFEAINVCARHKISLVLTSQLSPIELGDDWLIDLKTRLQAMVRYQVEPLSDDHKKTAIHLWFKAQGINLSDNLVEYGLNHCSRELAELKCMLEKFLKYCEAKGISFSINNIRSFLNTS